MISETFIYGLSNIFIKLPPFLLTPFLSKIFDPIEYSPFVNFYSAIGIISVFLLHGMETTIFRFANLNQNKDQVISNAFLSVLFVGIFFLFFFLYFNIEIAIAFKTSNQIMFINWFVWILFFDSLSAIFFVKLRLEKKIKKFTYIKFIHGFLYFFLVLFFILVIRKKIYDLYELDLGIGYTFLSNLIVSIIIFILLSTELFSFNLKFNFKLYKKMIIYAIPIMIAGLAGIINESIDRQFLKYLLPSSNALFQIGVYGACYKFSSIITLFKTAYFLGIEPFLFSQKRNQNTKIKYAILMKYFIIIISLILLFILANLSWIKILLIPNKKYYIGLSIVPIILIATIFLAIYLNLSIWYKITNKTYYGAIISLFGTLITIFINIFFIPKFSFYASAVATLISYFSMMLLSYFLGQKKYPIPYNTRKLIIYLSFSIFFGLVNFYIFNQNIWTGNFLLLFFIFIVYKIEISFMTKYVQKYTFIKNKFIK